MSFDPSMPESTEVCSIGSSKWLFLHADQTFSAQVTSRSGAVLKPDRPTPIADIAPCRDHYPDWESTPINRSVLVPEGLLLALMSEFTLFGGRGRRK